ncbi:hypothetical protein SAMN04488556_0083 [Halostagnicola kamekurae]|uniref:Uncharacterized protein n=1 Tax=Halostagnicola kamekurae TaxID=619731 RepID=A0A1I6V635_9EURY|nr:hypothetical protein SAMN04488556_0083 [Halostagnicola kamekurae]
MDTSRSEPVHSHAAHVRSSRASLSVLTSVVTPQSGHRSEHRFDQVHASHVSPAVMSYLPPWSSSGSYRSSSAPHSGQLSVSDTTSVTESATCTSISTTPLRPFGRPTNPPSDSSVAREACRPRYRSPGRGCARSAASTERRVGRWGLGRSGPQQKRGNCPGYSSHHRPRSGNSIRDQPVKASEHRP